MAAGLIRLKPFLAGEGLPEEEAPAVTLRRLTEMAWHPLKSAFFPPGLQVKSLYEDKAKHTALSVVRDPKGFHEPRHDHKGCGHWLYFLSGRLKDPIQVYTPGTFAYAPPLDVHGPFTAELQTDMLFLVDGPFDWARSL